MAEHLIEAGARALADARGDAEPTGGDRLLAEIVVNATWDFDENPALRPSPLHDFCREWFVARLGQSMRGYAFALAADLIEAGFTNEGNRR